jgi:hypothetical protein
MFRHKSLLGYSVISGAVIAIVLLLGVVGSTQVLAAGPYDGTWQGSAAGKRGYCQGDVTLTIMNNKVNGLAKFPHVTTKIVGTAGPDGTFNGTLGTIPMTGKFDHDSFSGSYMYQDCGGFVSVSAHRGG